MENPDPDDIVVIVITNLDEEDFSVIVNNLEFRQNMLIVCDMISIRGFRDKSLNHIVDSFKDYGKIVIKVRDWAKKNNKRIVAVIGMDEEYHYSVSENIAREYALDFYKRETLDFCSNKYLQRVKLSEAGVGVPAFQIIDDDTTNFKVEFPNVIKILTGIASMNVYLNRDKSELLSNLDRVRKNVKKCSDDVIYSEHKVRRNNQSFVINPKKQFILEEFIDGEEYSCDYFVSKKNDVRVLRVVKKIVMQDSLGVFDGFFLFNPDFCRDNFGLAELERVCRKVAAALGIDKGVCMMDFKFHNGKIFVIETTTRPGIASFMELMKEVYGDISINKLVRQKLGFGVNSEIPKENGLVVYLMSENKGEIKKLDFSGIEKNKGKLGVISVMKYYKEGDLIKSMQPSGPYMVGQALVRDVRFECVIDIIKSIRDLARIEVG